MSQLEWKCNFYDIWTVIGQLFDNLKFLGGQISPFSPQNKFYKIDYS